MTILKLLALLLIVGLATGQQCSRNQACPDAQCCSQWGYCGCTSEYCGAGCQNHCGSCGGSGGGGTQGEATYYGPYTPSSCYGFDTGPFLPGNMIAAASPDLFRNKALCGAIFDVTCLGSVASGGGCTGTRTVRVKVVDLCPGCHANSMDLSYEAFSRIANPDVGRIRISWIKVSGLGGGVEESIAEVVPAEV